MSHIETILEKEMSCIETSEPGQFCSYLLDTRKEANRYALKALDSLIQNNQHQSEQRAHLEASCTLRNFCIQLGNTCQLGKYSKELMEFPSVVAQEKETARLMEAQQIVYLMEALFEDESEQREFYAH